VRYVCQGNRLLTVEVPEFRFGPDK